MVELLAKPDVGLLEHLEEVLRLGRDIADRLKVEDRLRTKALLACALHDVGKATVEFRGEVHEHPGRAAAAPQEVQGLQERLQALALFIDR